MAVVTFVFCSELGWESSSQTRKVLLAGAAGPLAQGH